MSNKNDIKHKPIKIILPALIIVILFVIFFLIKTDYFTNALTETEAINILSEKLNDDRLGYMRFDDEKIDDEMAYTFKAFYDHADRIETQGHYYVLKKTGKVFKEDVLGGEPIMIP